jgi:16S rRNA (uracil1498-N3)-methyltransferase
LEFEFCYLFVIWNLSFGIFVRLHRFIGDFDFNRKNVEITDEDFINQFRKVLRFKPGDRVILGNGKMEEALAEIAEIGKDFILVKILELRLNKNESEKDVVLYCSILKRENFELVVQKATEIGIKKIVPIVAARTVKFLAKNSRLEKIAKEAAEQSGRGIVPAIEDAIVFSKAIEKSKENDLNLFFDFSGAAFENVKQNIASARKIGIFIGPEGGWDDKEIETARNAENFKIALLGNLSLRAETAAIVSSYIVVNC